MVGHICVLIFSLPPCPPIVETCCFFFFKTSLPLRHRIVLQAIPGGDRFSDDTLLKFVRFSIVPVTLTSCIVASLYNEPGCEHACLTISRHVVAARNASRGDFQRPTTTNHDHTHGVRAKTKPV